MLSPILNRVIDKCNRQEYISLLTICCVLTFWFGFLWKGPINRDGFNIMNFIFLYFVGRFVALYTPPPPTVCIRPLIVYIACSLFIAICSVLVIFHFNKAQNLLWLFSFPYNSPLIIISAIAFFLFFRTLNFHSKIINWLASSSLAVYLIHDHPTFRDIIYKYINNIEKQMDNKFNFVIYLLLVGIVILLFCVLFDKLRLLITNPIEKLINAIWNEHGNKTILRLIKIMRLKDDNITNAI
jgi:hypothetical protein